jgi:antitoxin (DNA-binding transcriptional repressor) of toxin-antitoxin stability system
MQTINATDFKARCLALLEEVARSGQGLVILKRGKPVAQVLPAPAPGGGFPQDSLKGTVTVLGDILEPAFPSDGWDAEKSLA